MFYRYSKKDDFYYVSQFFGYSLSHFGRKEIENGNADLLTSSDTILTDPMIVFEYILNIMGFYSYYIEDTDIYKEIVSFSVKFREKNHISNEELRNLSDKKRRLYYKNYDLNFKKECFKAVEKLLKTIHIEEKETIYDLHYSMDDKKLGFRTVTSNLFINDDIKIPLMTLYLSCFLEKERFIHIEPAISYSSMKLKTPETKQKYIDEYSQRQSKHPDFNLTYHYLIKSAIEDGLLVSTN